MSGLRSDGRGCSEQGPLLTAFLDGELAPNEETRLRKHLLGCDRCADDLAEQERARAAMRSVSGALTAPAGLQARIEHGVGTTEQARPLRRVFHLFGAMAAVLALVITVAALRAAIRIPSNSQIANAVDAHVQETLSVSPVSFSSSDPDVVSAWIRRQSGQHIEVASFAEAGYQLAGVRMEPSLGPRAIGLVYAGPSGRLTCIVLPTNVPTGLTTLLASGTPAVRLVRGESSTAISWADEDASYILVGQADEQTLLRLARMAAASS